MTKLPLRRVIAFKLLGWWRDMVGDLDRAQCDVMQKAERLHKLAGRMHVVEFEAYGDTKPRHTTPPATQVH